MTARPPPSLSPYPELVAITPRVNTHPGLNTPRTVAARGRSPPDSPSVLSDNAAPKGPETKPSKYARRREKKFSTTSVGVAIVSPTQVYITGE